MSPTDRIRRTLLLSTVLTLGACATPMSDGWRAYRDADFEAAHATWRPLAEAGDPDAQFFLGVLYDEGSGVAEDDAAAAEWYRRAAEQGNARAQNNLGLLYFAGEGVPASHASAVSWYQRAADQGLAQAQCNLGIALLATGAEADLAHAHAMIAGAARREDTNAQRLLGSMYEQGIAVEQDPAEAVRWYRRAAKRGDGVSQHRLGLLLAEDGETDAGARWLAEAAEGGVVAAEAALAILHLSTGDVLDDDAEAVSLLQGAAAAGHGLAQYNLGLMYAKGRGVERDPEAAATWIRRAAEQGVDAAQGRVELLDRQDSTLARLGAVPGAL